MLLVAYVSQPNLSSSPARSQDVCQNSLSAAEGAVVLVPVLHLVHQVVAAGYCRRIYLIEQGSTTANLSTDAGHSSV
jgi:hypothetical protein